MKRKLFLLLCALLTMIGVTQVKAYTVDDLTSDGWTQVTTASITGVSDNYYILVDANSSAYVMSAEADHYRPCYKTIADPKEHPSFVWNLEGSDNTFQLKSFATGAYFKQSSGWNTSVGDGRNGSTASLQFTLSEGKYSIQCVGQGLVGHWNDDGAAVKEDGENIAANKAAKDAPGFYLYSISKETYNAAIIAARAAGVSSATKESPVEVTSYIQNADWSGDWGAWEFTCTSSGNIQWGQKTLESWNASNVIVKQTLSGVPNGLYRLTADVISGNNDNKTAYVFATGAGESKSSTVSAVASAGNYGTMSAEVAGKTLTADNCLVTNGVLTVGINQPSGWIVADNFKLYYMGEVEDMTIYVEAYHNALTTAQGVDQAAPMNGEALTALQSALSTYASVDETNKAALQEATGALGTAASDATNSIAAYANAKAYLDEAATILAGTNVYTAEAYADKYTTPLAKYEARTLTNEEGNAFVKTSTGWHSNNTIDEILLSAWTIGGNQCHKFDTPLYINTWSTEGATDGSEFLAPFFEYWVGDGDVLGANTIVATVAGLNPNATYSFTIRARVRQTNNKTKIANGVTMKVGAGEAVDISAGAKFGTTSFYIGNFSAVGETDADGKLTMTMTVAENSNISWLSFYNAKWTEGEDLSAYIADYEFAKSTAIANRDNAAYAAVTGKEKVDLVNTITTYSAVDVTSKVALIEAKEALEAASNTFVTAAPAYIGIAELNPNVAATLGVALPTITSETVAADLDVNGIIVAEYTAGKAYAQDFTNKLGDWTNAPGLNHGQSWNGTDDDQYYDLYNAADRAMTQTVTLPKGDYALIAKGRAAANGLLTLVVGSETVTFPHKSDVGFGIATDGTATFDPEATYANGNLGRGWEYRVMTFTSDGETPVTLTFNWKTSGYNWCGLDDIELLCNPAALDYSALQTAYDAVVVPTLGFEAGEYAPYNNKENLENIAAAKSMLDNQNADNQDAIDNATAAITGMTWTANTEELNAIYGGDFTKYETINGQDMPYGWNLYNDGNNSRIMGGTEGTSNAGLAAASSGKALLMKFNATYGESEGYTMPLKGGKVYQIQFIYGGWSNQPNTVVSLTDPNGETITLSPNFKPATNDAYSNAEHWYQYIGYFAATADGNYKLHFNKVESGQQQIILGDIDLRQAASQTLTITDGEELPKFAPGTYPSATYSRSLTPGNKWGTICVPFNLKSDENIQFYNVSSIGYGVLNVETVTEVAAGVPAIFKKLAPEATISVTTNEATVVSAPAEAESGTNAKLVGTFTGTTIEGESAGNYFYVKTDQFWRGNENFTIPEYRAYVADISVADPGARLVICVDGEDPTAINAIEAAEADGALKDGKYLINGKVVLVKNGVKYGANGQKLN